MSPPDDALVRCLEARADLLAAWLVPAHSPGGRARVGVLRLVAPTHYELYYDLAAALASAFGAPIELVELRRASAVTAAAIVRDGRLLLDRDPAARETFVAALAG